MEQILNIAITRGKISISCSINEECLSYLRLLWQEEKIIEESSKKQVILIFSLPATVVLILIAVLKICCLITPVPQPEVPECFLSVFGDVGFSFCFPSWGRGSEFLSMTTASFKHLSFPVGKKLPLNR